ncbi:hypothetical protein [Paenibacillus sp. L3-i20]|uniref:hypothetical protein n=1 Tax=Paenibacillus sp. L3-i20 TaxID=2905833 RepID=UPI001EDDBD8A|nr:hypothetical protein [Paenibacillus sp. L3-i20]GKU80222.1 hypothetical protein L3i20_v246190 [Paenibacillus sp. L3-i20]
MTKQQETKQRSSYVFNLEIMIEDEHHTTALERLLHELNQCKFEDFRITAGIKLGELIEQRLSAAEVTTPIPITSTNQSIMDKVAEANGSSSEQIRTYMKNNTLIRLIVNRGLGIKLNIPCRIINMDDQSSLITVYHVDEKQVYTFRLNEIEDFIV